MSCLDDIVYELYFGDLNHREREREMYLIQSSLRLVHKGYEQLRGIGISIYKQKISRKRNCSVCFLCLSLCAWAGSWYSSRLDFLDVQTYTHTHSFSINTNFQLGAMMLWLFIRCVVLSPSSTNIYAFYFLRHLFAASWHPPTNPTKPIPSQHLLYDTLLQRFIALFSPHPPFTRYNIALISYFSVTQILLSLSIRVLFFPISSLSLSLIPFLRSPFMSFYFIYSFINKLFRCLNHVHRYLCPKTKNPTSSHFCIYVESKLIYLP